jgi:hypothetical protein
MQRRANWNPIIVDADHGAEGWTKATGTDGDVGVSTNSTCLSDRSLDWQNQRRSDLRFSIGVAIALALPAILALGFYEVAEAIMLIG